ncbi:MFS transporter [Roseimaritima sediminicola]|uniref:MFS transporter n=1 Tax=Roseimaritima sediminicola TaxID=2662066 RepID=UPI0013872529|nr:MFS transporter [Roseimaritima sediminicola]
MKSRILKRGFASLLVTQFFGAANDNILKFVLTYMVITGGVWADQLGKGGQAIVGLCFTLPFILLSGYAGQLADRFSKRSVSIAVKTLEIPIALAAGIGFWSGNLWLTLGALIALTCQSAFFGPAKYGMIPELVKDEDLSRANGTINMMTNIAVISGTLAAGYISDAYNPLPAADGSTTPGLLWLPCAAMVLIAAAGLLAVLFLDRLEPGDRDLEYDYNPFTIYITAIKEMAQTRMLMVMMAWGYFYLLAGLAFFILPEYSTVLNIDRGSTGILMGVLGVAVGVGCAFAGLVSGHRIEVRLIPLGAAGLVVFFALLGFVEPKLYGVPRAAGETPAAAAAAEGAAGPQVQVDGKPAALSGVIAVPKREASVLEVALSNVSLFIFGAGFFAGFYIIPLQALLQKLSPDGERGRFLGTANAVSFAFMTVSAVVYYAVRAPFGDSPQRIFLLCSVMMAAGTLFFLWRLKGSGVMSK